MFPAREATHKIQQDLENKNKESVSPDEIKTILHRTQQFNQFAQATTPHLFHQASFNQSDAPRQAQQQQPDENNRSGDSTVTAFSCDKTGHRETECQQKSCDIEEGTVKQRYRKLANQQETRHPYNRKLVCQIRSFTTHSAKYCRQCQQNSTPYGQIPYDRQSAEANK